MYFLFIDDSKQKARRNDIKKLTSLGGLLIDHRSIPQLIHDIDKQLEAIGVPLDCEIKWSPKDGNYIKEELEDRTELYVSIIRKVIEHGGRAIVIVHDISNTIKKEQPFLNCMTFLSERFEYFLTTKKDYGLVISDRPGGGKDQENEMLDYFYRHLDEGTDYVEEFKMIPMNLMSTPSRLNRLLQVADLVTGISTALVGGKYEYTKIFIPFLKKMFVKNNMGYIGGTGLKIFPNNLDNLYYHVIGEERLYKSGGGYLMLPRKKADYYSDEFKSG